MLAAVTSWWIVAAGALCVLAAWFYTGGSRPYGYRGLGEVSVFVFFGVAAVAGTAFVQMGRLSWLGLAASVPAGLLSCALLMVNNLRDIGSDATSGKRTLAVRIGDSRARLTYLLFLLVPFALAAAIAVYRPFALLMLLALPLADRAGAGGARRGLRARPDRDARADGAAAAGVRGGIHGGPGHSRVAASGRTAALSAAATIGAAMATKRCKSLMAGEICRPKCWRLPGLPQLQAITCR